MFNIFTDLQKVKQQIFQKKLPKAQKILYPADLSNEKERKGFTNRQVVTVINTL